MFVLPTRRAGRLALVAWCAGLPAAYADAPPGRAIYRCEIAGVPAFSDRPCGSEIRAYEPDLSGFNSYEAVPAPPAAAQSKVERKRQNAVPRAAAARANDASAARRAAECERMAGALREIRSRMRSGYGVKEGEQLKARQAKLQERRRAARCRS